MKKRLMSLLLISAMLLGFAGCKSGNNEETTNGEIVTLKWMLPGDVQSDLQSVLDEANKIVESEIGARLDIQFIDQASFNEKMKMNMAGGNDFDLCFTGYVNSYGDAVTRGGLMDITSYIDEVEGMRDIAPDYVWDMATRNGKIYGVPNQQIMATANAVVVFQDTAKKYDFDWSTVKHIDDIEPYLEMVKNGEPDMYPFRPNFGVIPWYEGKYDMIAPMILLPKGATSTEGMCYAWDCEEYMHGVQQLWNWYQKGYIRQDALSVGADDETEYNNGRYATAIQVWKPGAEVDEKAITGLDTKYITIDEPYITKEKGLTTMISVGANCKNPKKAVEFIKLINTNKELYNLICFGIEGKHYNIENDRVKVIEDGGYNNQGASWKFGNTFNSLLIEGQADDVWEETQKVNAEAGKSGLMAFTFSNGADIKTQRSNIATVIDEYQVINRGVKDPATYMDEFIQKMKDAGVEDVFEAYKANLDLYFESRK